MEWEKRSINGEQLRAVKDGEGRMILQLFALPFNKESRDLGGFVEVISPELRINRWNNDLFALHNHEWAHVLGREGAGTLKVDKREDGIHAEVRLADTQFNRDLFTDVNEGNIPGASFAFATDKRGDSWRRDGNRTIRTLREITLREFSTVPVAAYGDTEVGVALRNLLEYSQEHGKEVSLREAEIRRAQIEAGRLLSI